MPTINEDDVNDDTARQADGGGPPLLPPLASAAASVIQTPLGDPPSGRADTGDMDDGYGSDSDDDEKVRFNPALGWEPCQRGAAPPSLCSIGSFGLEGPLGSSSGGLGMIGSGGSPKCRRSCGEGCFEAVVGRVRGSRSPEAVVGRDRGSLSCGCIAGRRCLQHRRPTG